MYTKKFLKGFGLLLVVALLLAVYPQQAKAQEGTQAVLNVCPTDCTFSSIQEAINAASPGDTVQVAAGTYIEQLLIQKDLTLVGAGIGQTIVKAPTSGRATAPGYTSQVYSGDNWNTDYLLAAYPTDPVDGDPISVKVSGFTFDANGQGHIVGDRFTGVYFRKVFNSDISAAGLFNSEIKGFSASDPSVTGIRVLESSKLTLSGNLVKDYTILGIVVYGTDNLVDPIVNTIGNTLTPYGSSEGIQYRFINGTSNFAGTITGNTVNGGAIPIASTTSDHILIQGNTVTGGGNGIVLETTAFTTVSQNTITGCTYNGVYVQSAWGLSHDNLIADNTISGIHSGNTSTLGDCGWGIGLDSYYGNVANTIIIGNTVTSSDAGIVFYGVDATNVAHYNKLSGNTFADLGNSGSVTIDAMANWWGQATGPASGQIYGNASSNPWCTTEDCKELQVATGGSIQDAIDLAPAGGTVHVAAGTFFESDITIDKPLTLVGTGQSQTIIGPALVSARGNTNSPEGSHTALLIKANNVTIKDLTIDGNANTGLSPATLNFHNGIYQPGISTNNLTVENVTIQNVFWRGINLRYGGNGHLIDHVTVNNVSGYAAGTEDRYQNIGIMVFAPSSSEIRNCVVTNSGVGIATGSAGQMNIINWHDNQVSEVDAFGYETVHVDTGSVFKNNTATLTDYIDETAGFYSYFTKLTLTDSTFTGFKYGALVEVQNNPITDLTFGNGVVFTGPGKSVAGSVGILGADIYYPGTPSRFTASHVKISGFETGVKVQLSAGGSSSANIGYSSITDVSKGAEAGTNSNIAASPNWWGSIKGPQAGQIAGSVTYDPWCGDAACSFLVYGTEPEESGFFVQGGQLVIKGHVNVPGGIIINEPHIIVKLLPGAVVENDSPCFVVNASYTKIYAEPGAKCIPTEGSNGIDVAAGLTDIRVKGLEIDGTGQSTGDGIHFAGAINGVVLADNKIHNLGGDGVEFVDSPTGSADFDIDIHGNLFASNGGYGINNSDTDSPKTIPAEYNSWGSYNGPTGDGGDGVSANVDYDPYTYGDFWMSSSGSPWVDQVVKGQSITYTVKALVKEVIAADVTFTYPEGLTVTASQAIVTNFESGTLTHNAGTRTFTYIGMSTNGNEDGTVDLFSVTFTANANMRDAVMNIVDGSFGMAGVGSSSNVYVQSIDDGSITVIDLPTISSTDIQGYYLSGEERQFSVVLNNPSTGGNFAHVYVDFTIANAQVEQIEKIEYSVDNGANWVALGVGPGTSYGNVGSDIVGYFGKIAGGGFPLAPNTTPTTLFRVTFKTREQGDTDFPNSYSISMSLKDADTEPDYELDTFTATAEVYDKATVTITGDPYYIIAEAGNFSVNIVNPSTGRNYDNTAVFDIVIANHVVADIRALSCSMGSQTWDLIDDLTQEESNIVARIGGVDGYFTVPAPMNATINCSVTYVTAGTYTVSGNMIDVVSTDPSVERVVSDSFSATAQVYAKPVITPTNLGGPFDAGVPETISLSIANASIPEPFEIVFNFPEGTVIGYGSNTYTCTSTGCPAISVTLDGEPAELSFTVTFDEAWTGDVSVSLYDSDWTPSHRLLATASATGVVVNGDFAITGTFTMQGNLNRGGIPVTLTWTGTGWTYAASANTVDELVNNFHVTVTYGGGYRITTNQPRYLNLTTASNRTITVDGVETLAALMLRGGNVVNTGTSLDKIDVSDAGLIGGVYGSSGDPSLTPADANFDGRVNILDLALVGGNYLMESATAYSGWVPLP